MLAKRYTKAKTRAERARERESDREKINKKTKNERQVQIDANLIRQRQAKGYKDMRISCKNCYALWLLNTHSHSYVKENSWMWGEGRSGQDMLTDGLARLWSAWKQLKLVTLSCCFPFVWFSYVLWPSFSKISFPNKSFTNPFGTFGRHKFFRWLHSFGRQ